MAYGLTRENSDTIAFVVDCLAHQAIGSKDVRGWAVKIIEELDEPPLYIFDLADFSGLLAQLLEAIGFACPSTLTIREEMALQAIAYKRGVELIDVAAKPKTLLGWLENCPHIEERYRKTFPWIDF